jgi:murein endopeptidase
MLPAARTLAGLWILTLPAMGMAATPATAPASPAASVSAPRGPEAPAALLDLSDDELLARIAADPTSLGSLSIGTPGRASLFNSLPLPANPHWQIAPDADTYATSETIAFLQAAIDTVYELFPESPPLMIGDISSPNGGHLKRHKSHQGGRDVDLGYYYKSGTTQWFLPATAANFDLARNWALVRSLVTRSDVEMILLDVRIQRMLYKYALSLGEEKDFLDHVFACGRGLRDAVVQHVVGHRTHYHVRFFNPVAQEMGRRAHPLLVQLNLMKPAVYTVSVVVKKGQTMGQLAARYGTSTRAIMAANGMKSTVLTAGRAYQVPQRGSAPPQTQPLVVPHRTLPTTTPAVLAAVEWPTAEALYGTSGQQQDRQ